VSGGWAGYEDVNDADPSSRLDPVMRQVLWSGLSMRKRPRQSQMGGSETRRWPWLRNRAALAD